MDKQKIKNGSLQTLSTVEERSEYEENYLLYTSNLRIKNSVFTALGKEEYNFFVKRMNEKKIKPNYILKTGNELYFVAEAVDEKNTKGQGLYIYDVILQKAKMIYFLALEDEGTNMVLQAIDLTGNKLILVLIKEKQTCESLWLGAPNNFFSLDLLKTDNVALKQYQIPQWKTEEERLKFPECGFGV